MIANHVVLGNVKFYLNVLRCESKRYDIKYTRAESHDRWNEGTLPDPQSP